MKQMFRNIFFATLLVSTSMSATEIAEPPYSLSFTEVVGVFVFTAIAGFAFHEGLAACLRDV